MCWTHRHRSGWNSVGTHGERRRWVGAEWGGVCGGVSSFQPTRGLGDCLELPQRGRRAPAENGCWHLLKATNASFCTYMTKI